MLPQACKKIKQNIKNVSNFLTVGNYVNKSFLMNNLLNELAVPRSRQLQLWPVSHRDFRDIRLSAIREVFKRYGCLTEEISDPSFSLGAEQSHENGPRPRRKLELPRENL